MNINLTINKAFSIKLLIIYMVSALIFLSSIELHIHTHEAAVSADHGSAVSITSIADDFSSRFSVQESASEIEVSPDGMLHAHQNAPNFLLLIILLVFIAAIFVPVSISRIRKIHSRIELPFYGTPTLRAPPQNT